MPRPDARRLLAVELHDVAPSTWAECAALLRMLDDVGATNLTLLVVPRFHDERAFADDPAFVAALDERLARGDELCLHGYTHRDDEPPPRSLRGFVERRVMTRAEGEFAAIGEADAGARLSAGVAMFRAVGWPLHGFVPPAWLLGDPARRALAASGHRFEYVSLRAGIHRLPDWRFVPSANLCYSPDRRWRRTMSRVLIRRELRRAAAMPMLRMSLHPQDARVPEVVRHWRALAEDALRDRMPVTKRTWAALH